MTDTIYEKISADHRNHRRLLGELAGTEGDSEDRRRLWREFYYDVKSHAAAEEETFYSQLMEDPGGQDDARHSVAEHKELDDIMEELQAMSFSSPGWLTRFETLKERYEHHMSEEEDEIFAKARKLFDDSETGPIADRFEKRKTAERRLVDSKSEQSLDE